MKMRINKLTEEMIEGLMLQVPQIKQVLASYIDGAGISLKSQVRIEIYIEEPTKKEEVNTDKIEA